MGGFARYAFGDVHGHPDVLAARLVEAGLLNPDLSWSGGPSELFLTGDLADRGPGGYEAIQLVRRLEREAGEAGGRIVCLLGNHDLLLLAVARFGDFRSGSPRRSVRSDWLENGGQVADLERLLEDDVAWLAARPALERTGSSVIAHSDSDSYLALGSTVEVVNRQVEAVLRSDDFGGWEELIVGFSRRLELADPDRAANFVARFECERVVHGHTPIPLLVDADPASVTGPFVYADGRCVNVDGGLYLGGPGFLWELPP